MEMTIEQLQALLDILAESGVEEFEGMGLHVKFTPSMFTKENQVPRVMEDFPIPSLDQPLRPSNMWEMPELWPGGKPPSFPGK